MTDPQQPPQPPQPQDPPGAEEDPGANTEMFRAFMAGDRPGRDRADRDAGRDRPSQAGADAPLGPAHTGSTSATRFRAVSLVVGLAVFAFLVWLLLQA